MISSPLRLQRAQWALLSWSWRNRTGLGWWTVIVWRCRSIKARKGKAGCRQLAMDQWAPLSLADVCRVLIYFPDSPDHKLYTKGFSDHRGHAGVSWHVANIVVFQFLAPTHSARCSFLSWLTSCSWNPSGTQGLCFDVFSLYLHCRMLLSRWKLWPTWTV